MLEIGLVAAFLGGTLTLLAPCSALLLPAFFAYAFQSPAQLLRRTGVFYAGLVTLLVPLGMGIGAVSTLVNSHRQTLIMGAGVLLVGLGLLQIAGRGFGIGPLARLQARIRGDSTGAVFALGLTYAFAGFCSGPILGGVLTMAATSGTPARGATLLAVYALGMAAPAFALALVWERLGQRGRARLRGRERRVGRLEVHPASAVSGLLFIAVGATFLVFEGTVGLTGAYSSAGMTDIARDLDAAARGIGSAVPDWAVVATVLAVGAGVIAVRSRRTAKHDSRDGSASEASGPRDAETSGAPQHHPASEHPGADPTSPMR